MEIKINSNQDDFRHSNYHINNLILTVQGSLDRKNEFLIIASNNFFVDNCLPHL
jgi:hypothetical protein